MGIRIQKETPHHKTQPLRTHRRRNLSRRQSSIQRHSVRLQRLHRRRLGPLPWRFCPSVAWPHRPHCRGGCQWSHRWYSNVRRYLVTYLEYKWGWIGECEHVCGTGGSYAADFVCGVLADARMGRGECYYDGVYRWRHEGELFRVIVDFKQSIAKDDSVKEITEIVAYLVYYVVSFD